ncbi:MAG: hypothetical protein WBK26_12360 [Burkholderiaceae bacterium]
MEHQQHGAMPGTTAPKNSPILYEHPDGYTVGYTDNRLFVVDDNGLEVRIPIGPRGLIELGLKMMAVGTTTEALAALKLAAAQSAGGTH